MTNRSFGFSASSLSSLILLIVLALVPAVMACGGESEGLDNTGETDDIVLAITYPQPDAFENRSRFRVQGTAQGASEVEVNGETTSVTGGNWEILLDFAEGPSQVVARAGQQEVSVDFFVDTIHPTLVLESPDRGSVVDSADAEYVVIRGQATDDGSGVLAVLLNGSVIEIDQDGNFEREFSLTPGLNVIELTARDRAQNESVQMRAILHGPLTEATEAIENAITLAITREGIDSLADVIEAYATPAQIMEFVEAGLEESSLTITDLEWEELNITIVPRAGFLEVEVEIIDLRVDGIYEFTEGNTTQGYIAIARMTVELDIAIGVDENNELDVQVIRSDIELDPNDIESDFAEDNNFLRNLIAGAIVYTFTEFVGNLIGENLYDPDVLIQEYEFLDRRIEITFILEEILITSLGIHVELGVEFPADAHPNVDTLAGALNRVVGADTGSPVERPIRFQSTRTALDRILHAVWRAGLFHQGVGGDELSDVQLPFDLTADGLASLLDQRIRDVHQTDTPVELRFRPLLPPVVEFGATQDDIHLEVGDFLIDIFLRPEGEDATHLLTLALYLDVEVEVVIEDSQINFALDIEARGDIAEEPLFSFDRHRTVGLITDLIELVPLLLGSNLSIDGKANFDWATIGDPQIAIYGHQRDRVGLGVLISPATDFIDEDDVENDAIDNAE